MSCKRNQYHSRPTLANEPRRRYACGSRRHRKALLPAKTSTTDLLLTDPPLVAVVMFGRARQKPGRSDSRQRPISHHYSCRPPDRKNNSRSMSLTLWAAVITDILKVRHAEPFSHRLRTTKLIDTSTRGAPGNAGVMEVRPQQPLA